MHSLFLLLLSNELNNWSHEVKLLLIIGGRYNAFIGLYPVGALGEILLMGNAI